MRNGVVERLQANFGIGSRRRRNIRQDLQRKVMVAHDKFVAGQRIERLDKFLCLGDRKVTGICHARLLPLQQPLPRRLREKRK